MEREGNPQASMKAWVSTFIKVKPQKWLPLTLQAPPFIQKWCLIFEPNPNLSPSPHSLSLKAICEHLWVKVRHKSGFSRSKFTNFPHNPSNNLIKLPKPFIWVFSTPTTSYLKLSLPFKRFENFNTRGVVKRSPTSILVPNILKRWPTWLRISIWTKLITFH